MNRADVRGEKKMLEIRKTHTHVLFYEIHCHTIANQKKLDCILLPSIQEGSWTLGSSLVPF